MYQVSVGFGDLVIDFEDIAKQFLDLARGVKEGKLDTAGQWQKLGGNDYYFYLKKRSSTLQFKCLSFGFFKILTTQSPLGKIYKIEYLTGVESYDAIIGYPLKILCPAFEKFFDAYIINARKAFKWIPGYVETVITYEVGDGGKKISFYSEYPVRSSRPPEKIILGSSDSFILLPPPYDFNPNSYDEILQDIREAGCNLQGLSLDLILEQVNKSIKKAYLLMLRHFLNELQ